MANGSETKDVDIYYGKFLAVSNVSLTVNPRSITARSFANPKVLSETGNYNLPEVRRLELPAATGTGRVGAVAGASPRGV